MQMVSRVREGGLPKRVDLIHVQNQGSKKGPGTCQSVTGCADRSQELDQESDEATASGTSELAPNQDRGEQREWRVYLPTTAEHASRQPTPRRHREDKRMHHRHVVAAGSRPNETQKARCRHLTQEVTESLAAG